MHLGQFLANVLGAVQHYGQALGGQSTAQPQAGTASGLHSPQQLGVQRPAVSSGIVRYDDPTLKYSMVAANRAAYGHPEKIDAMVAHQQQQFALPGQAARPFLAHPAEGGPDHFLGSSPLPLAVHPASSLHMLQGGMYGPQQSSQQLLQGGYQPLQRPGQVHQGNYLNRLYQNFNGPSQGDF